LLKSLAGRRPQSKSALPPVDAITAGGSVCVRGDAAFLLIGSRKAVFSQEQQQLYELDDTAAYVWCRLEEEAPAEAIAKELVKRGMTTAAAETAVVGLLERWLQSGLLEFIADGLRLSPPPAKAISIAIAGVRAQLAFSSERLARLVVPCVAHLETAEAPEVAFELLERGDLVHIFQDAQHVSLVGSRQVWPVVQRCLMEAIIGRLGADFVLHTATLVKDGRALLVTGRPGAGKTTLSFALDASGFDLAGDDIAILKADGRVEGVPFTPAVKAGSWPLVAGLRDDVGDTPVYKRLDGRSVRYVRPRRYARAAAYPVEAVVFLHRRATGGAALTPVEPFDGLSRLIDGALAADGAMTPGRLKALDRCVSDARLLELSYARLDDAASALERMWHAA